MKDLTLNEYLGTLSEAINALKKLGYTLDFNIQKENNTQLSPNDFQIDKVYRFEGMTDPEDQAILYAISSPKLNVKGILVSGYGISSDEYSSWLISKLIIYHSINKSE